MSQDDGNTEELETISQAELNGIIRKHIMFLTAKPGGRRAVVRDKDLSNLTFSGQNLSQSDFTGCILAGANLSNANFESSTLFGCDFTGANLSNTSLIRADMRGADVGDADLSKADLTGADLREGKTLIKRKTRAASEAFDGSNGMGTQFTVSNMSDAVLKNATAIATDFSDTILSGAQMQGANLKQAILRAADMKDADLSGADLRDADLTHATMVGANMEGTETTSDTKFSLTLTGDTVGEDIEEFELTLDELIIMHMNWLTSGGKNGRQLVLENIDMRNFEGLSDKKLTALKATSSTFAEMTLNGIEMQSARMEKCDFRKSLLVTADLRGSNFSGGLFNRADLSKANLMPLKFKNADGTEYQIPCNFSDCAMRHAIFTDAKLTDAVFTNADLSKADFTNADLRGADFSGAFVNGANFEDAQMDDVKGLERL